MHRPHSPGQGPREGLGWILRRFGRVVVWSLGHPGRVHRHWRWVVQGLGFGRFLQATESHGGRLDYLAPRFLERHAQSLDDPAFVPADQAEHLRDDDVVLGIAIDGKAKAYPWWIMDDHHYANDVVSDRPVAIMLCEQCSTAVAFDANLDGKRVMFDHGPHYNGTNTLVDRDTGSVWSAYLGVAILGKRRGTKLPVVPLQQMTWAAWQTLHPDTEVLADGQGSRTGHGSQHTIGLDRIPAEFSTTVARWDDRLPRAALVMGAIGPNGARVYPIDALSASGGVVNDDLGGIPILVSAYQHEGSFGALAFSRSLAGRVLTFRPSPDGPLDDQTGSRWTYEGVAVDGPLAGSRLDFISSHVSEWYVWATHFPAVEIWSAP